jgi:hypothetical protein
MDVPFSLPLHRLPSICPLIEVLDLSYNKWLRPGMKEFERVAWARWSKLRVLGLRGCEFRELDLETLARVNEGRWNDVEIVL